MSSVAKRLVMLDLYWPSSHYFLIWESEQFMAFGQAKVNTTPVHRLGIPKQT